MACYPTYPTPCCPPAACCPQPFCYGPPGPTGPTGPSLSTPTSFFQAQLSIANGSTALTLTTLTPFICNAIRAGNLDSAYNIGTGIYTAPRTGYYLFDVNVVVNNTTAVATFYTVSLLVNGVATNTQAQLCPGTIGQDTQTVFRSLLSLTLGQQVQVSCFSSGVAGALTYGSNVYPTAAVTTFQCTSLF